MVLPLLVSATGAAIIHELMGRQKKAKIRLKYFVL